ncbi:putative proteasome endopeptidase complex [Helianthus anomalus]
MAPNIYCCGAGTDADTVVVTGHVSAALILGGVDVTGPHLHTTHSHLLQWVLVLLLQWLSLSQSIVKGLLKVVNKVLFLNQYIPTWRQIRNHNYTNVYMKWKSDSFFDSIESIHKSTQLKPVIAPKNRTTGSPDSCIPVSDEFTGPKYNLPWFRLTPEAAIPHDEEQAVYRDFKADLQERLRKLILMSVENKLSLKIIKGMLWYLGLPEDYLDGNVDGCFKVVEMGDGLKRLSVVRNKKTWSVIQRNALRTDVYNGR